MFAATFLLSGAWFDVGRVDSLFLFLLLLAVFLSTRRPGRIAYLLAALFLTLAYLTKQVALLISLPLLLFSCLDKRSFAYLVMPAAVAIAGATLVLDYLHDGWFFYYIFSLPAQHAIKKEALATFWTRDLLIHLPVALALVAFFPAAFAGEDRKRELLLYGCILGGMVGGAWISRLHSGGYHNVLLPAYAAIAIAFGPAYHQFSAMVRRKCENGKSLMGVFIQLACLIQFVNLLYNPLHLIPTRTDREFGNSFLYVLRQVDGEVFVPSRGFIPSLAGKATYAHECALHDIMRGAPGSIIEDLQAEIAAAIREQRFAAIILDAPWPVEHEDVDLTDYYTEYSLYYRDGRVFLPVTGVKTRPRFVYLAKKEAPAKSKNKRAE